jgi:hypothetical protein
MTQARKTQVLTLAALAVAFVVAVARKQLASSSAPAQPSSPQDAIYAMLDASRAGDVRRYLSSYGGQMRASLEQSVRESGEDRFGRYLKESNAAIKGVALSEPQPVSSRESQTRVEYVYQDRNEAQNLFSSKPTARPGRSRASTPRTASRPSSPTALPFNDDHRPLAGECLRPYAACQGLSSKW